MKTKELREKHAAEVTKAGEIIQKADAEKRELTPDEQKAWDTHEKEASKLEGDIRAAEKAEQENAERRNRQAELEKRLAEPARQGEVGRESTERELRKIDNPDKETPERAAERRAFLAYLRGGMEGLDAEQRKIMAQRRQELRALTTTTGSSGGFTVPTEMERKLEAALLAFGGMREVANILTTDAGNDIPFPTANDTGNTGEQIGENVAVAVADPVFSQVLIKSYIYSSKAVLVPISLLEDNAVDLEQFLANALAERIYRIQNQRFTTGTGTSQPNGIVTASTQGKVGLAGQTTSVIYADLVDLEHSVDPSYRKNAGWMMHDSTIKALKKMTDSSGRPLWQPGLAGLASKEPATLMGYPYTANQDMAVMAANAKSILFGDLKKYLIRQVRGVAMMRLVERYADSLQVGFIGYQRADGNLLNAGTNPVKHYANSAT